MQLELHLPPDRNERRPLMLPAETLHEIIGQLNLNLSAESTEQAFSGLSFPGIDTFVRYPEEPNHDSAKKGAIALAAIGVAATSVLPIETAHAQSEPLPITPEDRPSVVFIGDSISVGANEFGGLSEKLIEAGMNLTFNAEVSRPLVLQGCETDPPTQICIDIGDGLRALELYPKAVESAEVVVLALGTNDSVDSLEQNITSNALLADSLGSTDNRPPVILMPEYFYTTGDDADKKNEILNNTANELRSQGIDIRLIPLSSLEIPTSDGVHPTGSGARLLADYLASTIAPIAKEANNSQQPLVPNSVGTKEEEKDGLLEQILGGLRDLPSRLFGDEEEKQPKDRVIININNPDLRLDELWGINTKPDPELTRMFTEVREQEAAREQPDIEHPEAGQYGVFYENGQPRIYLSNFTPEDTQTVTQGFADIRDVGNGTYRQGNVDFSTGGIPTPLLAPGPAIVHVTETRGEGFKVVLEFGVDPETGYSYTWYATHLSEVNVQDGDIVLPGDVLGMSGDTGTAHGIHNSIGVAIQPISQLDEYLNSDEALNPLDFMPGVNIYCRDSATDDDGELCGPTNPGQYFSIPLHPDVVAFLGLDGSSPAVAVDDAEAETGGVIIDISVDDAWDQPVDATASVTIEVPKKGQENDLENKPTTDTEEDMADSGVDIATEPQSEDEQPNADAGKSEDKPVIDPSEVDWNDFFESLASEDWQPNTSNDPAVIPSRNSDNAQNQSEASSSNQNSHETSTSLTSIFTPEIVTQIIPGSTIDNARLHVPLVIKEMEALGLGQPEMVCYAFANITPETHLNAIDEGSSRNNNYGDPHPVTGQRYYGRGLLQATHYDNYKEFADFSGIDVVNNPDLMNDPEVSAKFVAWYIHKWERQIRAAIAAGDLKSMRQIVNGPAAHGLDEFTASWKTCMQLLN